MSLSLLTENNHALVCEANTLRKESDSDHEVNRGIFHTYNNSRRFFNKLLLFKKEAPVSTSVKASFIVEASVIIPLAITFFCMFLFVFRMYEIQIRVQQAMDEVSRYASVGDGAVDGYNTSEVEIIAATTAKIATKDIPYHYIEGGAVGINLMASEVDEHYIDLISTYTVKFPINILGEHKFRFALRSRARKWVGWDATSDGSEDGETVYVAENGTVYHRSLGCTHLDLSTHSINYSDLDGARNESGGKYSSCPKCKSGENHSDVVFITNYGDSYHSSIGCSGLKRTVHTKKMSETAGMPACSRCGN